jgi:hypothetical protein
MSIEEFNVPSSMFQVRDEKPGTWNLEPGTYRSALGTRHYFLTTVY